MVQMYRTPSLSGIISLLFTFNTIQQHLAIVATQVMVRTKLVKHTGYGHDETSETKSNYTFKIRIEITAKHLKNWWLGLRAHFGAILVL